MSGRNVRGLYLLAACLTAAPALAQDLSYTASSTSLGGLDLASRPGDSFTDAGIDRLLQFNSSDESGAHNLAPADAAEAKVTSESDTTSPLSEIAAGSPASSGMMVVAGLGAALTLGLGLCCAGMLSGRQRTINTFTAGLVRMK